MECCSGQAGGVVPPPMLAALSQAVRQFETGFEIADEDAAVTAILPDLLKSRTIQGKQIHDANIVATMRRYGIPSLLTHNTANFTRYLPGNRYSPADFLSSDPELACRVPIMSINDNSPPVEVGSRRPHLCSSSMHFSV